MENTKTHVFDHLCSVIDVAAASWHSQDNEVALEDKKEDLQKVEEVLATAEAEYDKLKPPCMGEGQTYEERACGRAILGSLEGTRDQGVTRRRREVWGEGARPECRADMGPTTVLVCCSGVLDWHAGALLALHW